MTPAVEEVTASLRAANVPFEPVADIAALAARKDPAIRRWSAAADLRIFGLPHRAVKWLFHAAGAELPENAMALDLPADPNDDLAAAELVERLLGPRAGGCGADDTKPAGKWTSARVRRCGGSVRMRNTGRGCHPPNVRSRHIDRPNVAQPALRPSPTRGCRGSR